ncbi:hypothetical protein BN7_4206 [Wickerhamomyces ciferrii]|uniref:Ribosomal lysine N-methyltransferase 4 n=1 Tax=Wickerhamomyces ciferrii (strain ATCC 14091 / BCRC 22168 / CBS 111 / JCM 3599 / NBRC 0793 / NRRL Y-1031 F-60-10) TaxID=1206466 RepID=K0KRE1_WICCF|nr:uncharacterized protein BN7_4206 [Wickerhamomyces ciferrii]CCH44637.1 hypothetical protein BN7_4206 [Wickerhamomyces ciferrii]
MSFTEDTHNFQNWLINSGVQISPKIKIEDLRYLSQGRGLISLQDINQDEILFKIPRNVLLNIETGSLSQINNNKEKLLTNYDHWEGLILTILYELSLGNESKWFQYFKILPNEFHSLMFWEKDELELLKPSLVLDRIGQEKALETFNKLIPNALVDLGINHLNISLDLFHKVASTILSYSFDVERPDFNEDMEDDEQVQYDGYFKSMVTLADLLNADTNLSNANLFYETEFLIMKSIKPIPQGQQIYNTYGDHPNSELLRRYGYVEYNGSKFDFGELPISTIKKTLNLHFNLSFEFIDQILDIISQSDVEELEEDIVLESYDVYLDGEILPESQILIQSLIIIAQINQQENLTIYPHGELIKIINRILKKCYQLIESGNMTYNALILWEQCILTRLNDYPSHSFRDFLIPPPAEQLNKLKMSECILKYEVLSLQKSLKSFNNGFKLINDEKLIRNILKRKLQQDENSDTKKIKKQKR